MYKKKYFFNFKLILKFDLGHGEFILRPYAESFLLELSEFYEIVIFTAGTEEYANFICDILDF